MLRDFAALESGIDGEVIRPGSPGYDLARQQPITRFRHVRPQVIVRDRLVQVKARYDPGNVFRFHQSVRP